MYPLQCHGGMTITAGVLHTDTVGTADIIQADSTATTADRILSFTAHTITIGILLGTPIIHTTDITGVTTTDHTTITATTTDHIILITEGMYRETEYIVIMVQEEITIHT